MIATISAAMVLAGPPPAPFPQLLDLAEQRKLFDSQVVVNRRWEVDQRITTNLFSHRSYAFYPFGVSDRRYLLYFDGNTDPALLIYQSRGRDGVRTRWCIQLAPTSYPKQERGTLRRLVGNYDGKVVGKLSRTQREALWAEKPFAVYGYGGDNGTTLFAWILKKDGSMTKQTYGSSEAVWTILPEEINALRVSPKK